MLRSILSEAAKVHDFDHVATSNDIECFQRRRGESERFLILKSLAQPISLDEIHEEVLKSLPDSLKIEPSFQRNCDLVLVYRLGELADFKAIEDFALTVEEDPYHFKKYFLYYSEAEERAIFNKGYSDFVTLIQKMDEFADYKKNPLKPSMYSVVARTFIKLPFLEVPRIRNTLQSLPDSIAARVSEEALGSTFSVLSKHTEDVELLIQELLDEELENIKAQDSGV